MNGSPLFVLCKARKVAGGDDQAESMASRECVREIADELDGQTVPRPEQKRRLAEFVEKNPDLVATPTAQLLGLEQGRSYHVEGVKARGLLRLESGQTLKEGERRYNNTLLL